MMNLLLCRDEVMRPFCSGQAHLFLYTEKRPATLVSFWKLLLIFTGRLLHRPVFTVFFSVTHWMYFVAVHLLIFLIRFYECLYFLTFVYKSGQFTARLFHKIWENTFFFYFFFPIDHSADAVTSVLTSSVKLDLHTSLMNEFPEVQTSSCTT